jgi:excisionase family DNA binding protein
MPDDTNIVEQVRELAGFAIRCVQRVQRGGEISARLLDVDDAARYLGMSDKAIRELIADGELPYIQKIPARSPYLLDVKDLDKWVEKNKIRAGE